MFSFSALNLRNADICATKNSQKPQLKHLASRLVFVDVTEYVIRSL